MAEEKSVKESQSLSNFVKEDKGNNTVRNAAIAGTLAVGTVAAAVGLGAFRGSGPTPSVPPQPDHTAAAGSPTPDKTIVATPTGKVEVTISPAPTASPTPEVKKEVPCVIMPVEFCSRGELVTWQVSGKTYTFIGFNFREGERVPIFAVVDGRLLISKENSKEFVGTSAAVQAPNGEVYDFKGNIDTSKFGNLRDISVKAGDIIGYIGPTNAKSLGSYDGVFTISKAGSSGPESQIDKLKALLPGTFERPSKNYVSSTEPKTGTGVMFQEPGR